MKDICRYIVCGLRNVAQKSVFGIRNLRRGWVGLGVLIYLGFLFTNL